MGEERCYSAEEAAISWKKWRIHLFEYIDPNALNEKDLTIKTWIGANENNWEKFKYKNNQVMDKLKKDGIKIERQRQTTIRHGNKVIVHGDPIPKICKPETSLLYAKLRNQSHVGAGLLLNTQRSADFNEVQINVPLEAISFMKDKKEATPKELEAIGKEIIGRLQLIFREKEEERERILGLLQQELSLSPKLIKAEEERKENLMTKGVSEEKIDDDYQKYVNELRKKNN